MLSQLGSTETARNYIQRPHRIHVMCSLTQTDDGAVFAAAAAANTS